MMLQVLWAVFDNPSPGESGEQDIPEYNKKTSLQAGSDPTHPTQRSLPSIIFSCISDCGIMDYGTPDWFGLEGC